MSERTYPLSDKKYEFGVEYIGAKLYTDDFNEALERYRHGVKCMGKDSVYICAPWQEGRVGVRGLSDSENEQIDLAESEAQAIYTANGGTKTEEA